MADLKLKKRFNKTDAINPRDLVIVEKLSLGWTSKQIGAASDLSVRTIETVVCDLIKKYDCQTRSGLVGKFMREGWVK